MKHCIILQNELDILISKLATKILKSGIKFDCIVGILQDGLKVSRALSHIFNVPHYAIKISHYDKEKLRPKPIINGKLPVCRCLIIDLLVDSGATLKLFRQIYSKKHPFAVLYWKLGSIKPTFYVKKKPTGWLVFPRQRPKRVKIIIGTKYHKLTCLKQVGPHCLVKCECGHVKYIETSKLGYIQSCGCSAHPFGNQSPTFKGVGEITMHNFRSFVYSAKKRGLEFNLTKEYIWSLFLRQKRKCALSGVNLEFQIRKGITNASLDRKNNKLGYIKGNIQWVHKDVNMMKSSLSQIDFINWCHKISKLNKI